MILASPAQKDAPKIVEPAAQATIGAVNLDSSAFGLLLAFMNPGANALGDGSAEFAGDLDLASQSDESKPGTLADQAALAAKFAEWLASNPASLAALRGLVSGSANTGLPEGLVTALVGGEFQSGQNQGLLAKLEPGAWLGALTQPGMKSDQMQGLLAKSEPGAWLGALTQSGLKSEQLQGFLSKLALNTQAPSLDGAAQGVALVSAIEQAGDSQSMAAALMAAVSSGLGRSASTEKSTLSSNLFLANGLHSDLSLADALSKAFSEAVTNGAFGIVGSAQIGIVGSPRDRKLTGLGFAATESVDQTLASNLWLEQQSSSHNQKEPVHLAGTASTDEQRQRQLEQSDALLSPALPGSMSSFDGLQQAMSAQSLGRASFANANALEGTVSWLASQQGGSATIDLSPPELGSLRLELKIDAGGESAVLIVHAANDAAKAAIEQSLDRLYESFQSSGMSLQVSVGSGSAQFAGMFSNGFEERSKVVQEANRVAGGGRSGSISSPSSASGVASDALSLYA